jgi:hypothetical protein
MSALAPALMQSAAIVTQICLNFIDLAPESPIVPTQRLSGDPFGRHCPSARHDRRVVREWSRVVVLVFFFIVGAWPSGALPHGLGRNRHPGLAVREYVVIFATRLWHYASARLIVANTILLRNLFG